MIGELSEEDFEILKQLINEVQTELLFRDENGAFRVPFQIQGPLNSTWFVPSAEVIDAINAAVKEEK